MTILLTGSDAYVQLITVLLIFVLVLGLTLWVTRWIAKYQRQESAGRNAEVIESVRIANNKWVQIIRIGHTYKCVALGKDEVTYLGEVSGDELKFDDTENSGFSFRELYEKAIKANPAKSGTSKESKDE
ncbi:MAG: flagellar biosynthetic protein FliO [Lachnospiraceae bacterium]|nr:flagellar biosynthetic protein FliO [Lachnospiraceae bacterium]